MQGTFIGVLMSSTLPARLGEPSRALVVARRTGRPRENLPVVLGTLVSQTLLNLVALAVLGAVMFSSVNLFSGHQNALLVAAIAPVALLVLVLLAPVVLRRGAAGSRLGRLHAVLDQARRAMTRVRAGLAVFRQPRLGAVAALAQFAAWALQWLSCYVLLVALGLSHQAGMAGCRRRAVRGQHHRRPAGHAGQPRRLPGRVRRGAAHRLACRATAPESPTA